jgi:hypothetical protein
MDGDKLQSELNYCLSDHHPNLALGKSALDLAMR